MVRRTSRFGGAALALFLVWAWGCSNDRTYPKPDGPPIGYWQPLPAAPVGMGPISNSTVVLAGDDYLSWSGINFSCSAQRPCPYGYALNLQTGAWREISTLDAPNPRYDGGAIWTGTEVIVWAGDMPSATGVGFDPVLDGGAYNPSADTWRPISVEGAPSPREVFSMVWTGSEVLVWGGEDATSDSDSPPTLGDGALYDPVADSWRPMSNQGAPSPRTANAGVWTGQEYVIWGGVSEVSSSSDNGGTHYLDDGAAYDPVTDSWRPMSSRGAPAANSGVSSAWTGKEVLMWGGAYRETMAAYDPAADTWRSMDPAGPHLEYGSCVTWTGRYFVVCGDPEKPQGALYDPELDHWQLMGMDGAPPSNRSGMHGYAYHGDMIVFGGIDHLSNFYDLEGYRFVIPEE